MGTGKKLIKNTNERHEALKFHKAHINKSRVTRELEEADNDDDKDYTEGIGMNNGHRTLTAIVVALKTCLLLARDAV